MHLETFQMVDRVVAMDAAAGRIEAACTIPATSAVFEGHFPGYPLMPGVLLIEVMAQTTGMLVAARLGFSRLPLLAQVKEAKLRARAVPGQALAVSGELIHQGSGYAVTRGRIASGAKTVADAELVLRCLPFPTPGLRETLLGRARAIGLAVPAEAA